MKSVTSTWRYSVLLLYSCWKKMNMEKMEAAVGVVVASMWTTSCKVRSQEASTFVKPNALRRMELHMRLNSISEQNSSKERKVPSPDVV
jgi:hypothetical protein